MTFLRSAGYAFVATLLLIAMPVTAAGSAAAATSADNSGTPMTVGVQAVLLDNGTVDYRIAVTNAHDREKTLIISHELPEGSVGIAAGKGAEVKERTVTWKTKVKPAGSAAVGSTALPPASQDDAFTTVCVADAASGQILDCAGSAVPLPDPGRWWERWSWALLIGLGVAAALLWLGATLLWRWWARRLPDPRSTGHNIIAGVAALTVLGLLVGGALLYTAPTAKSISGAQPGSIQRGWYGPHRPMELGSTVSDDVVEFTAYRVNCSGKGKRSCTVVTRVRNISAEPQPWRRSMQRLYVAERQWTTPDANATAKANGGRDIFAEPLAPNEPFIAVVVFPVPEDAQPLRVELREGLFARGVYLPF